MRFDVQARSNLDKKKVEKQLSKALAHVVRSGETEAAQNAPVDTGNLKSRISTIPLGPFHFVLQSAAEYSIHVEKGTDPHVITPSNKEALYWPGADHPVKKVEHPGTDAQPFMEPALDHMVEIAPDTFDLYLKGYL